MSAEMKNKPGFAAQASAYWQARTARERSFLSIAAIVVTLGLAYALLIDPALSGRDQLRTELPTLRQQAALMHQLSREAATLARKPLPPAPALSKQSIESSLAGKGLSARDLRVSSNMVVLKLRAVPFSALLGWLDNTRKSLRLVVSEAELTALEREGMVNASLTLHQPEAR